MKEETIKIELPGELSGKSIYVKDKCLRHGERGKFYPAEEVISVFNKSAGRQLRKALRRAGFSGLAGAKRIPLE